MFKINTIKMIQNHVRKLAKILSNEKTSLFYYFLSSKGTYYQDIAKIDDNALLRYRVFKKECFNNALLAVLASGGELEYVEGFYVTKGIALPFEHAWNLKNGKVYDLTAKLSNIEVEDYFGIKLSKGLLLDFISNGKPFETPLMYYFRTKNK